MFFERKDRTLREKALKHSDPFILPEKTRGEMIGTLASENPKLQYGGTEPGYMNVTMNKVAGIFRDVLQEPEFKGQFKEIVFAIREKPRGKSGQTIPVGKEGRFKPFYELFGDKEA